MQLHRVQISFVRILIWHLVALAVSLCFCYLSQDQALFFVLFGLLSFTVFASLLILIFSRRTFFVALTDDYIEWGAWRIEKVYWVNVKSIEWQSSDKEYIILKYWDGGSSVIDSRAQFWLDWPEDFMKTLLRFHKNAQDRMQKGKAN